MMQQNMFDLSKGVYVIKTDDRFAGNLPCAQEELYYFADENALKTLNEDVARQGLHAGVSRKIYSRDHLENAMREAHVALMQDFIDINIAGNAYPYRSASTGRLRRIVETIKLVADDEDTHVALNLLEQLRLELKNGQYNIRQALFAYTAVNVMVLGDAARNRCVTCISHELDDACMVRQCDELYIIHGDMDMLFEDLVERMREDIQTRLRSARSSSSEVVQAMIEYINEHYHTDISLKQLSERFYLNPGYICRIFKRDVGLPLSTYLVHLRIRHACRMLRHSGLTVADIAQRCGYSDYFYFARQFKRVMNVTPTQYRKCAQEEAV